MNATATISSNNPGAASAAASNGGLCYLRRPAFFRDQLLTDQDLEAVTNWVQGKFSLRRLLHGWGVVCGLAVYCDPDEQSPSSVFVGPGYALDATGQDIVVAEEASLDLSTTCLPQGGRCAPPAPTPPGEGGDNIFGVPSSQVSAYDLYITHAETGADARHVPRRGVCKDASGCEYARQIEKYNLTVRPVTPAGTPTTEPDPNKASPAYEQWKTDAHALVTDVAPLVSGGEARLAELRARLSAWIAPDKRPPYQFGFLADQIAHLKADENRAAHLVFWLLQDGRARLLSCRCAEAPADPAVLLARLWLWTKQDEQGRLSCQVFGIDSMPPYRRPLRLDPCWPAPPNQVNLGRWIGASPDDPNFNGFLAEWNITASALTEVTYSFGDLNNFNAIIDAPRIVQRGTKLTAIKYLDMGPLGRRVVAFLT